MRLDEKKSGMKMELRLLPKRVKAAELTVMTRQLATMVSSGMTLLRAFYVLEDQVENDKLKDTLERASARTSSPASTSPTRSTSTRRCSARSTSP